MPNDIEEMQRLIARMPIPEPASNLESRIIAAAKPRAPEMVRGGGWFISMWQGHAQKFALAAVLALLVAIALQDPSPETGAQNGSLQVAANSHSGAERYTVDGTPLLQDIEVNEDTEWYMAEIAMDADSAL